MGWGETTQVGDFAVVQRSPMRTSDVAPCRCEDTGGVARLAPALLPDVPSKLLELDAPLAEVSKGPTSSS